LLKDDDILLEYYAYGYKVKEIQTVMENKHHLIKSESTLKNRLSYLGAKRRNQKTDLSLVFDKIHEITQGSGIGLGYRY
jgi:hypothetical protein